MTPFETVTGEAAGVPFIAVPPATPRPDAPVVLAWHLMDPPRSEAAFAAALPLSGLDAWRIYLGLPLTGARLPAGGMEEFLRLGYEDAVVNLHGPVTAQAVAEAPAVLAEVRERFDLGAGPVAVVGGSAGAAAAASVVADGAVPAAAAVLVSPLLRLRPVVSAMSRRFGVDYRWSPAAEAIADRLDFVARAGDLGRDEPAVLLVVGADDDEEGFLSPAAEVRAALAARYADPSRVALVTVPGMAHALAEEPGLEPAPQTTAAAEVDRHAVSWLRRHLIVAPAPFL